MRLRAVIGCLLFLLMAMNSARALDARPEAGKQVEASLTTSDGATIPYLIYLPSNYDAAEDKLPLMLFLHGRGESHGPLSLVAKWGPPMMAEAGEKLPYILVSPQCPSADSWSKPTQQSLLLALLAEITTKYKVDTNRVYLSGLSMGGYGSWRLAADHPDRFAAVIPVCGGGDPKDAEKLKSIPIWVFHGDQDRAVPFSRSVEMVDAIKAAGGEKIRFTSMEHIGHNCWSATYATPELYDWMLKQQLTAK